MFNERERIIVKTCPVCGKKFIPAIRHIYKSKGRLVCTYSCMLKNEEKEEKKELSYCSGYENTKTQSKRYAVLARRDETEEWSNWTEVEELDRAFHHFNKCQELGYLAKVADMPLEVYFKRGAKEALAKLRNYIMENKIEITSENFDLIVEEALQENDTL